MRIVLGEDNEMLATGIQNRLADCGNFVEIFANGAQADSHLASEGADIAIVDINLPDLNGLELIKKLRARRQNFPVLLLTARSSTDDRVNGLDAGADDYMVKPFAMAELEARIRALTRRKEHLQPTVEKIGLLSFQHIDKRLFLGEKELDVARREKMLFEALLDKKGYFVSKSLLADALYGIGSDTYLNAVELSVSRLRKVIRGGGVIIRTARGIGYMMEAETHAPDSKTNNG